MKFHISIIAHYIKTFYISFDPQISVFLLLSNVTLSYYTSIVVTVSFEMSDNALFELLPIRPFKTKHLPDLVYTQNKGLNV